ncbi:MAG: hypothetical protein IKT12_01080, partial [Thermoguttaceae bacterium]|nr:hypothetical protein [Thermoguttaceae bacterium]
MSPADFRQTDPAFRTGLPSTLKGVLFRRRSRKSDRRRRSKLSRRLFTSEAVSMGHPDKLADRISDSILDACLTQDPGSHVACETLVTTGLALIAGEIATRASVDYEAIVRQAIREVGYLDESWGMNAETCEVRNKLHEQSPDIAQGVNL